MSQIQEIIGAVNYWVDEAGIAHAVRNHVEWACQNILHTKVPQTLVTEGVYSKMYHQGWMRVAVLNERINVDYSRLSGEQLEWLQHESNDRKIPVYDNTGHTIIEPEPSVAESVVARLIND